MNRPRQYLWLGTLTAFAFALQPLVASSESLPVEAVNEGGVYGETHRWSNVPQSIGVGEAVRFVNSTEVPHGVEWRGAVKPVCEEGPGKVPVGSTPSASGTHWSGSCTFSQAGSYLFYCTVHGAAMRGTITVTNPGAPAAVTEAAGGVGETTATLNGSVNPNGKPTHYFFRYGTTTAYGQTTTTRSAGEGAAPEPVAAAVSGLAAATTYHFRLVAENEKGTLEGTDETFTTVAPGGPPTASTGQATSIGQTETTLEGTVNPDGEATQYLFQYGSSAAYGQSTAELALPVAGHAGYPVTLTLTGLAPGTTYHFRLIARNAHGTAEGVDRQFTTASTPITEPSAGLTATPQPLALAPGPFALAPAALTPAMLESSLRLTAERRRGAVHGSLRLPAAAAGGRLQVDLLGPGGAVAHGHHARQLTLARLTRHSLAAGSISFSLALSARGKRALRHARRLGVTVKITLTPPHGSTVLITRRLLLRA